MTWFTENPWPLILILVGISAVGALLGGLRGRNLAAGSLLLAAGLYFLEAAIVTPAEQIETRLESLLDGFEQNDLRIIAEHIDDQSPGLIREAERGLELVTLDPHFHMQNIRVHLRDDGEAAEVELRANGTMTLRRSGGSQHVATRWKTVWTRHQDVWRLSEVHRLNPVTGEQIGLLDAN